MVKLMRKSLIYLFSISMLLLITPLFVTPYYSYVLLANSDIFDNDINLKISPTLIRFLNDYNSEKRIQVIVLFKSHNELELRDNYLNSFNIEGLEEIETFHIIPAALYSVPIDEVKKLASFQVVKKIYLNEKFQAIPPTIEAQFTITKDDVPYNETVPKFINADKLWPNFDGSGIKIAILDTGVSASHPDLKGKIILEETFVLKKYNFDFDENATDFHGHGTHVAGIAAGTGVASNGIYRGVAPGAQIINAKCLNMFGQGTTAAILKAIDWAVSAGADIISMSLGTGVGDPNDPISIAAEAAVEKGIIVVAAAGNSGPYYSSVGSPGAAYGVITVGACDWEGRVASFSSRGPTLTWSPEPDVLAPGVDVIAPLAPDSYMQRAGLKLGTAINRTYISLSGTSMATPAVAGAAALLLQAFPDLKGENPYAIRIALMETAKTIGLDENTQGAGIIDVYEAYRFLNQNLKGSSLPVVKAIPTTIPLQPQVVRFPGDEITTTVILLSGTKCNIHVEVEGNITSFVHLENTTFNNVFGVVTLSVKLGVPITVVPGRYIGQINFVNSSSDTSDILANISLDVKIEIPRAKALFDWYHNFDFSDSPWSNYYLFTTLLADMLIDLDVSEGILTLEKLEGYDVLILPDVELMFTPDEEYAIRKFVENGGSLLVLGSFYQAFAAEPLNRILTPYGISFTNRTISKQSDLAIVQLLEETLNITQKDLIEHPITNGVQNITWVTGVALETENRIGVSSIAYLEDNTVIAAVNETVTNGGRIVVFGCERNFYDDLMEGNPSHSQLERNVFEWLLEKDNDVLLLIENHTYMTGSTLRLAVYVLNETMVGNLSVRVLAPSSNFTVPLNSVDEGILEGYFILNEEGTYTLEVIYGTEILKRCLVRVSSDIPIVTEVSNTLIIQHPSDIEYPSWVKYVEGIDILCRLNDSIEIAANIVSNDSNLNVTLYLSPYLQFSDMSRQPLTFQTIPMTKKGDAWVARFDPDLDSFSDLYVYYVVAKNTENDTLLDMTNATGMFLLVDIEPEVLVNSTVEGQTIEEINETTKAISVSLGDVLSYKIYGSDVEDSDEELEAFALIVDYDIYAISGLPLLVFKGKLTEDGWEGEIRIPENGTVETVLGTVTLRGLLVLFLILRDKDGQVGYQYTLLYITAEIIIPPFSILTLFIIAVVSLIIVLIVAFALYRKKRRKEYPPLPEYYPTYQIMNYCPYCGAKLPLGARYCPFCGAKLIENKKSEDEYSREDSY